MKRLTISGLTIPTLAALAVLVAVGPAMAVDNPWNVVTGNWNTAGNWLNGVVPSRAADQFPVINNAGTAQLGSAATSTIGGLTIGSLAGESGTLEISPGGSLTSTNSGAGVGNGIVTIGATDGSGFPLGTGTLRMTGGTFNTRDLNVGPNAAANLIELSGNATLAVVGNAGLGGTTRITGSSANFTATNFNLRGTSVINPVINSNTTWSTLKTTTPSGVVTVQGSIQVTFSGVTPPVGSTWSLFEGGAVVGNFTNAGNVPVTGVPAPVLGEAYRTRLVNGGAFGKKLELVRDAMLVLQVDRSTGIATILNPLNGGIQINSYSVASAAGSLKPATWNSLADQGTPNWQEGNSTAGALAEFNATTNGNFNFASVPSKSIGEVYDSGAAFFTRGIGGNGEDLVFDYLTNSNELLRGQVVYTGVGKTNSLVVTINAATGAATLKNDSPGTINIDGFSILSTGGALIPGSFNGLGSPLLTSVSPTANALSQLAVNPNNTLAITAGQTFNLGSIFTVGQPQTGFSMEFTTQGGTGIFNGAVQFQNGLSGDFNGDSRVDGTDFLVWQRGGSPSPNSAGDLATWRANYGQTASTAAVSAVPEPGAAALIGIMTCCVGAFTRRRGGRLA